MAGRRKRLKDRDVLPLLDLLIDKNLVVFYKSSGEHRYRLSETVRDYLRELYGHTEETAECRIRHRGYFRELTAEMEPKLMSDESKIATERLAREHDNIRLAIDSALHEDPVDGLRMIGSIWRFWSRCGFNAEGRSSARQALEITKDVGDTLDRAKVFQALGSLSWPLGETDEAEEAIRKSLAIYEARQDPFGAAGCMLKLGNIFLDRSEFSVSRSLYERSLAIFRNLNHAERISTALNNIANIDVEFGDYESARKAYIEAIDYARKAGVANAALYPLSNIAEIHLALCEYDKAYDLVQSTLREAEDLGEQVLIYGALLTLGKIAHAKGEMTDARTLLEMAVRGCDSIGDSVTCSTARMNLSLVNFELGDQAQAIEELRKSLSGFQKVRGQLGISQALDFAAVILSDPRLWALGQRMRGELGAVSTPHHKQVLQPTKDRLRGQMGDAAFDLAWREGEAMTIDEALQVVLGL